MIFFFTYHKIRWDDAVGTPEFYSVARSQFVRHLDVLVGAAIPGADAAGLLQPQPPNGPRYVLSFDDATLDHYETAFPLLRERGLRGVFFVPTGKLNRPGHLTNAQVQEMSRAGQTIGLHSHEHKRLDLLDDDEMREQFGRSKRILTGLTGAGSWIFAPPGGFINEHVREVALGFGAQAIRTMRWGFNEKLDLTAMETIPVNRYTDDRIFRKIIEQRQSRFLYFAKETAKTLVPAHAYERLRGLLFRLKGKY